MTKHSAGKHGRTIGVKERKAGWPAPATAWCYLCSGTHRWVETCSSLATHPAFMEQSTQSQRRRVAA